jgi:hypothetical protein
MPFTLELNYLTKDTLLCLYKSSKVLIAEVIQRKGLTVDETAVFDLITDHDCLLDLSEAIADELKSRFGIDVESFVTAEY